MSVKVFDDSDPVMKRSIELMGGQQAAAAAFDADFSAMNTRWDQDVSAIGRILRAHLYVEHYLTEHLQQVNPRLPDLDEAKLNFFQKVLLLDGNWNIGIRQLVPGIQRLNKVRNRLAHNLAAVVTDEDVTVFLSGPTFRHMRNEIGRQSGTEVAKDPLDILEEFAKFAASTLHNSSSAFGKAYEQAIKEHLATP
jgi:hypothetical protein